MKKFIVLTYDVPHRKTYDLLTGLIANGCHPDKVYSTPFHYQKKFKPLYEHRPGVVSNLDTATLCRNLDIAHETVSNLDILATYAEISNKTALIAGAGIIPTVLCEKVTIINSHPGLLPEVRGLDAVKWSILEKKPVGVTLHYVTPEVDAGEILVRREIPIYAGDTFHSIAHRNYELEIQLMIQAISHPQTFPKLGLLASPEGMAHKRMSHELEEKMMASVLDYIQLFKQTSA